MSLRVIWRPAAERDLLFSVPDLATIISIDAAVIRVAETYEHPAFAEPVERIGDHPRAIRLRVAGRRVVSMLVDAQERTLIVLSLDPEPDPDADAEPDEYEEDE